MTRSFIAHTTPGRSKVFALVNGPRDRLEAVTTLGSQDVHLTDALVDALNVFLHDRDGSGLDAVLNRLPQAVRLAVQRHVKDGCPAEPGDFTECGPVEIVRGAVYFSKADEELAEYLDGAYVIGLGIRMSNERRRDGRVGWVVQLRSDEVSVPASGELRTWPLPEAAELLRSWTSAGTSGGPGPVREALDVAEEASVQGRWVRIHTLLHGRTDIDFEGSGTSEFVVDVFDVPMPLEAADE